jgi:hypothetical protein
MEKGLRAFFLARCNASRAMDSSAAGEPNTPGAHPPLLTRNPAMNKTLSAAALILSLGSTLAILPAAHADDMKMDKEASMEKDMKMDKKMADDMKMDMSHDKKMDKGDNMMKDEKKDKM